MPGDVYKETSSSSGSSYKRREVSDFTLRPEAYLYASTREHRGMSSYSQKSYYALDDSEIAFIKREVRKFLEKINEDYKKEVRTHKEIYKGHIDASKKQY